MASITITTTAPQDARLASAFGELLNVGATANTAQIKAWMIEQLRGVVITYEIKQGVSALTPPAPFTPS
jgi:hypothetical protein